MSAREQLAQDGYARLLRAIGSTPSQRQTRAAASLWCQHIAPAEGTDPRTALGRGQLAHAHDPVLLRNIDMHLVCPHHLTVAFGTADVAYVPGPRLVGFGRLVRLVETCTARLILQEDATALIAHTLKTGLDALAAVACLRAQHPCHALSHPRGHRSQAITWASAGDAKRAHQLRSLIKADGQP